VQSFTVSEAAEISGHAEDAIRSRVDRGELRCVLCEGLLRIPRSELRRVGLLGAGSESPEAQKSGARAAGEAEAVRILVARVEAQAKEIAKLRARAAELKNLRADRHRLESELSKARVLAAEAERLRAERSRIEGELTAARETSRRTLRCLEAVEEDLFEARTRLAELAARGGIFRFLRRRSQPT
jgi:chromosome segregation ATPase